MTSYGLPSDLSTAASYLRWAAPARLTYITDFSVRNRPNGKGCESPPALIPPTARAASSYEVVR